MVLLLTDVFLLLTQILIWLVVGLVTWFLLLRTLPRAFLGLLVLLLLLAVIALSFIQGPPADAGILQVLWRIISFPFTPLGLGLILLIILLSGRKLGDLARKLMIGALILLALGSIPFVSYFLAQELEFEAIELIQAQPALPAGARRVIVLLGQNTTRPFLRPRQGTVPTFPEPAACPPGCNPATQGGPPKIDRPISAEAYDVLSRLPVQLTERGDNIIYAAQLYREETARGTNPLIFVSAGPRLGRQRKEGETKEDVSEARDIQIFLTQMMNVPEGSILLDHDGVSMRRSAENARRILVDEQRINYGNQITVVGTGLNMNRAFLTFRQVFDEATIFARPTDFYALPEGQRFARVAQGRDVVERQLEVVDFIPTIDAFYISSQAIEEYLNALYYFLRGWIKPFERTRYT